jgi:hypothetical protein
MTPWKRHLLPVLALVLMLPLAAKEPPDNRNARFGPPSPAKADPKQREAWGRPITAEASRAERAFWNWRMALRSTAGL